MEIREGVFSYPIERTKGNYAGEELFIHVLHLNDGVVQFGSGDKYTIETVKEHTTKHGVDTVIVEHADPDHYGGAERLRASGNVEIAAPTLDAPALEDQGIHIDTRLQSGERFQGIHPIATPGHTPGNMAYLYDNILIAGDTVIGSDFGRAGDRNWTGELAMLQPSSHEDSNHAYWSVERLLEYEFDTVLVTHGSNVLQEGKDAVRTLVADLERHDSQETPR